MGCGRRLLGKIFCQINRALGPDLCLGIGSPLIGKLGVYFFQGGMDLLRGLLALFWICVWIT